jgi:glucokinase
MIGAVDIGGTKFAVGMLRETGEVLTRAETPSMPERGAADGIARIVRMLRETAEEAGEDLQGIGIGCTGPVYPLTGKLGRIEFLPGWEGINLVEEFQRTFGVHVAIENDADAAALAEFAWGAGKTAGRFIYITISTGIGGGIILDGHLYRGADGSHPEIGHHVIDPSGPQCFCGARGCWESLASGPALARRAGMSSAHAVCQAARQGEADALAAVEQEGFYLGLGLANLVTLFVPDVIALGGGLMQSWELFWEKIGEIIQTTCGLVPYEKTHLLPAMLGRDAGLVGAAQVWMQRFGQ